jgi:L-alanine-DL-glutamate epimerase-like enolase superfamily enzyme
LYLAFELSNQEWKLGFTVGLGQHARQRKIAAGDTAALKQEIALAKQRFDLPADAPVVSCYEAGRDGFWLHRFLEREHITNLVVDSAGIEVPRGTPENMAEHSYEYFQQGIRGIKAKVGSDPVRDAECIVAIREKLGPGIGLRADANCGYTLNEAKSFCKLVEASGAGLELLEQPLETHDLAGFRELRNATALPIEVDESAYSLSMVQLILKHDAADIINTKCAKAGGIKGVTEWAAVAEASHRPIVIGTEWGLGLKVAAKLHLGAAVKNADPVVEFTEMMIHELLLKEPLQLEDGYLRVPTGPGLGLELDEEKIEAFRTRE